MTKQDAIASIFRMNNDELNEVIEAVKMRRTQIAKATVRSTIVGDKVKFKGRGGAYVTGEVVKVNRKTLTVLEDGGFTRWRVTASLVEPA